MNQVILLLNTAILVATFVVALTSGNVQGDLLDSAIRTAGRDRIKPVGESPSPTALLRVVQSMENHYPANEQDALSSRQLGAIENSINLYYSEIRSGIHEVTSGSTGGGDVRGQVAQLDKAVRADLDSVLQREFSDPTLVRRLTTGIIRNCN